MELMKVGEYSKAFGVSVQSVYQRIAKGTLKSEIKDGIKYVKVFDEPLNNSFNKKSSKIKQDNCKDIIKVYKRMVKNLEKQIVKLEQKKDRDYANLEKLFNKALDLKKDTPLIEAELVGTKKKKKKKSKGKKK